MAAWIPVIKVVLPYLAPIFQAALPVFTKKKSATVDPVVAKQIGELQDAVNAHGESTKALARAIEEAAEVNDRLMKNARMTAAVAVAVAVLSLLVAAVSFYR